MSMPVMEMFTSEGTIMGCFGAEQNHTHCVELQVSSYYCFQGYLLFHTQIHRSAFQTDFGVSFMDLFCLLQRRYLPIDNFI